METFENITIETTINSHIDKVWEFWTLPEHITGWNFASDDWCCPWAKNDLRTGGNFSSRLEAKDGSFGFDFGGKYDTVKTYELIEYTLGDNRKVKVTFQGKGSTTKIVETFDAEKENPVEMQRTGWQCILDNFKKYVEQLKE